MKLIIYISSILIILLCSCSSVNYISYDDNDYLITMPDANWLLTFPKQELSVEQNYTSDVSANYIFNDSNEEILIAIEVNKLQTKMDAFGCREAFIKNPVGAPFLPLAQKATTYEIGEAACLEYFVHKYEGQDLDINTISAIYVREGYSIILHVSKVAYESKFHDMMLEFIRSIKFRVKVNS